MPTVATEYRSDFEIHEEIPLDVGVTLSCPVYDTAGDIVEADSGTFQLLGQSGAIKLSGSVTTSSTYTATYEVTASALAAANVSHGFRYRVRWALVIGTQTVVLTNAAGVVRDAFINPVTDNDLTSLHSELDIMIQGTGETDLGRWTRKAYQQCARWMARQGNRPSAVLEPPQLKELCTAWSLEILFRDLSSGRAESHYAGLADYYMEERKSLQGGISFAYDSDQDGEEDESRRSGVAALYFSSHGDYRGDYR